MSIKKLFLYEQFSPFHWVTVSINMRSFLPPKYRRKFFSLTADSKNTRCCRLNSSIIPTSTSHRQHASSFPQSYNSLHARTTSFINHQIDTNTIGKHTDTRMYVYIYIYIIIYTCFHRKTDSREQS